MKFKTWFEQTDAGILHHTTSLAGLEGILRNKRLEGKPFVSMSEQCLFGGDISHADICLGISKTNLQSQMVKVEYDEEWFQKFPEQGAYIAGEGWAEQWHYEPSNPHDEWGDDEEYENQYQAAQFNSFYYKSNEQEWVSLQEGQPVMFQPGDVKFIVVGNSAIYNQARQIARSLPGYSHVETKRNG